MAKTGIKDQYSNKAYGTVTESAANTLTFSEIQTNVSIFEKVAWVIERLEWYISNASQALLSATEDLLSFALTASSSINALSLADPAVIDLMELGRRIATEVGFSWVHMPIIRDFSNLPGGGLIVPPRPLFLAAKATSVATPSTAEMRFFFRQVEMTPADYLDLIDFYRIVI